LELKYGALSPYVRKVMVVAHETGAIERIKLTSVKTQEEPERIVPFNPLGKIPALVLDDGSVIFDSPVICEYLDAEFGERRLLPAAGARRWRIMTRAALADGLLDAGILVRHERLRPAERQSQDWIAKQLGKIFAGLDALERDAASFNGTLDMGQIAVGCALGYLPLRIPETVDLAARWPRLAEWSAEVSKRASFANTKPVLPS
jgi:glutathione S-transferase